MLFRTFGADLGIDLLLGSLFRPKMPMDTILLRNFRFSAVIGPDAWSRLNKPQPIVLTLKLLFDTTSAGASDEIAHTFSYGQMCKDVTVLSDSHFSSIDELIDHLVSIASAKSWPGESLQISLVAPKALLRVEGGLSRELTLQKRWHEIGGSQSAAWHWVRHAWLIKQVKVACIIGVNPHERLEKQQVSINLDFCGEFEKSKGDHNEQLREGKGQWMKFVSRICSVGLCFCRRLCPNPSLCRLFTCMSRSSSYLSSRHWKHWPL